MKLDRAKLIALMEPTFTGHAYEMDAKPALGSAPDAWKLSDCSGFVRWLLYGAECLNIPDGSVNQHDWAERRCLKQVKYSEVGPLEDSILRIAFMAPTETEAGHVWLLCSGMTIECHAPNGPSRRPWNTPVLLRNVAACYELGELT
jgi:hypothetical protein